MSPNTVWMIDYANVVPIWFVDPPQKFYKGCYVEEAEDGQMEMDSDVDEHDLSDNNGPGTLICSWSNFKYVSQVLLTYPLLLPFIDS